MREQRLNDAVEEVRRAAEAFDYQTATLERFCLALDRVHAEVRALGGKAPPWNSVAGAVDSHVQALISTIPAESD